MKALEAAKALAKTNGTGLLADEDGPFLGCAECGVSLEDAHAPDCPWLAMPQIVAVLEAAERVAEARDDKKKWRSLMYESGRLSALLSGADGYAAGATAENDA